MEKKITPKNLNIFIGNLPESLKREDISKYFMDKADIERIQLPVIESTGLNKGYMYLKCRCPNSFKKIIGSNHIIEDVQLILREYYEPIDMDTLIDSNNPQTIIFLKGIGPKLTNDDLFNHFNQYGGVKSAYAYKGTKKQKQYFTGYVQFNSSEAVNNIPSSQLEIGGYPIRWNLFNGNTQNRSGKKKKKRDRKILNKSRQNLLKPIKSSHLEEKYKIEFKDQIQSKFSQNDKKRGRSPYKEFYNYLKCNVESINSNHTFDNILQFRNYNKKMRFFSIGPQGQYLRLK